MKFGKQQQIAVFEDNGLPLFDGSPARPEENKKKQSKLVWVSSPWDNWINAELPEVDNQPQAQQDSLF